MSEFDALLAQNFQGGRTDLREALPGDPDELLPQDVSDRRPKKDDYSTTLDVIASPFRGVVGAVEGLLELPGDIGGLFHESLSYDLPDNFYLGRSKSTGGALIEGLTQFLVPFKLISSAAKGAKFTKHAIKGFTRSKKQIAAVKAVRAKEGSRAARILKKKQESEYYSKAEALLTPKQLKNAKWGARIKPFALGGATDLIVFTDDEMRLSNLFQSIPALQNPVTEFLAMDEDDPAVVSRIKNVLEGGLAGLAVTAVWAGLKHIVDRTRLLRDPNLSSIEQQRRLEAIDEKYADEAAKVDDALDEVGGGRGDDTRFETDELIDGERVLDELGEGVSLSKAELDQVKAERQRLEDDLAAAEGKEQIWSEGGYRSERRLVGREEAQGIVDDHTMLIEAAEAARDGRVPDFETAIDSRPHADPYPESVGIKGEEIIDPGQRILQRLESAVKLEGLDKAEAQQVRTFIESLGGSLFGGTRLRLVENMSERGLYDLGRKIINIRKSLVKENGQFSGAMVHELWHHAARNLPKAERKALLKQFYKERDKFLAALSDGERKLFNNGVYDQTTYRYSNLDEYFAETMKDEFFRHLDDVDKLAPKGSLRRISQDLAIIFKEIFASVRAKLGGNRTRKIFNDYLRKRYQTPELRAPSLDMFGQTTIRHGKQTQLGRMTAGEFSEWMEGLSQSPLKPLPDLPKGFSKKASDFVGEEYLDAIVEGDGLFHATTNLKAVLREGLKPRSVTGRQGLGGGDPSVEKLISVTYNKGHAHLLEQRLRLAAEAAQGKKTIYEVVEEISGQTGIDDPEFFARELGLGDELINAIDDAQFGFEPGPSGWEILEAALKGDDIRVDRTIIQGGGARSVRVKLDPYAAVQILDQSVIDAHRGPFDFVNMGDANVGAGLLADKKYLASVDIDQIGTVEVAARKHKLHEKSPFEEGPPSRHLPEETEIRFDPEDVYVLRPDGGGVIGRPLALPELAKRNHPPATRAVITAMSGSGSMEAAMRMHLRHLLAIEFDPVKIALYNKAHGTDFRARDFLDLDPKEIAKFVEEDPELLFHISPVCTNFSNAGKGIPNALDDAVADHLVKLIKEAKPPKISLENAPRYRNVELFDRIVKALDDEGYKYDIGEDGRPGLIVNSKDYGGVQSRERLILRAVKNGDVPKVPEKSPAGDWYEAVKDLIDAAEDKALSPNVRKLLDERIANETIDPKKPLIIMGSQHNKLSIAEAGGPCHTLTATEKTVPVILMPDGTSKRLSPEIMRRLMGLPDNFRLPDNWKDAKNVLGNGIHGVVTRGFIRPMISGKGGKTRLALPDLPSGKGADSEKAAAKAQAAQEKLDKMRRTNKEKYGSEEPVNDLQRTQMANLEQAAARADTKPGGAHRAGEEQAAAEATEEAAPTPEGPRSILDIDPANQTPGQLKNREIARDALDHGGMEIDEAENLVRLMDEALEGDHDLLDLINANNKRNKGKIKGVINLATLGDRANRKLVKVYLTTRNVVDPVDHLGNRIKLTEEVRTDKSGRKYTVKVNERGEIWDETVAREGADRYISMLNNGKLSPEQVRVELDRMAKETGENMFNGVAYLKYIDNLFKDLRELYEAAGRSNDPVGAVGSKKGEVMNPEGMRGYLGMTREEALLELRNFVPQLWSVLEGFGRFRAQTGKALRAFRTRSSKIMTEEFRAELINQSGGKDQLLRQAKGLLDAIDGGGNAGGAAWLQQYDARRKFVFFVNEYFVNMILSSVRTMTTNIIGNAGTAIWGPLEAMMGARFKKGWNTLAGDSIEGLDDEIAVATDELRQVFVGVGEAFKWAKESWKRKDYIGDPGKGTLEFPDAMRHATTAENLSGVMESIPLVRRLDPLDPSKGVGRFVEGFGNFLRTPSRFLMASDEFFKQLNYRAVVTSNLMLQGRYKKAAGEINNVDEWVHQEMANLTIDGQFLIKTNLIKEAEKRIHAGLTEGVGRHEKLKYQGLAGQEQMYKDQQEWIKNALADDGIKNYGALGERAARISRERTFTTDLDPENGIMSRVGVKLQELTHHHPTLRLFMPFIRTPLNILLYAGRRTTIPLVNRDLAGAAEYLLKYKFGNGKLDNIKTDFARRLIGKKTAEEAVNTRMQSEAMGQALSAIGLMGLFTTYAANGNLTGAGPQDKDLRKVLKQNGWQPYSFKVPGTDTWVSYQRLDPFATVAGLYADMFDVSRWATQEDQEALSQAFMAMFISTAHNIQSKSYLQGMIQMASWITEPERSIVSSAGRLTAAFTVPSFAASFRAVTDDTDLEVRGYLDHVWNRIPFLSSAMLDPQRNVLGEPIAKNNLQGSIKAAGGLAGVMLPISINSTTNDGIARELALLEYPFANPSRFKFGTDLTQHLNAKGQSAYDRFLELTGTVKIGGRNLRKAMVRLINSRRYRKYPYEGVSAVDEDSPRVAELHRLIRRYRARGLDAMLGEFDDVRAMGRNQVIARRALRENRDPALIKSQLFPME